jgi:hypothetical protein
MLASDDGEIHNSTARIGRPNGPRDQSIKDRRLQRHAFVGAG